MTKPGPVLHIATYHYVRDLPRTAFPRIKGMMLDDFQAQVEELSEAYEMASLSSALDFLKGAYTPPRDLCLLTFDDGLKEHFAEVTPILAKKKIQGIFHLITGCTDQTRVAPVHMNHLLMATLQFDSYRSLFLEGVNKLTGQRLEDSDNLAIATSTYPLDTADVARFKYVFNFALDPAVRDNVVRNLFATFVGDEEELSKSLYLSWDEARQMQDAGMVMGGHTYAHRPMANLSGQELREDTRLCWESLRQRLHHQEIWPFCYPYGRRNSYSEAAAKELQETGFDCSFTTESEVNQPGVDLFAINRTDCNKAWPKGARVSRPETVSAL